MIGGDEMYKAVCRECFESELVKRDGHDENKKVADEDEEEQREEPIDINSILRNAYGSNTGRL